MVADYAEIVGGKLYVMGGGWDTFGVAELPAQVRLAVAVGVRIGWDETNQPVVIRIVVEDDDGKELLRMEGNVNVGRPPEMQAGSTQLAQMAANVPIAVQQGGGFRVVIRAGEGAAMVQRTLPFRVNVARR